VKEKPALVEEVERKVIHYRFPYLETTPSVKKHVGSEYFGQQMVIDTDQTVKHGKGKW
jgi:hypothetical protein